jgi:chemotaxis protein histidine kinase CheA
MATVNKNFRIKHGLVVEGSTATVNGQNILTETGSDQYILNLVGGQNLIDSVASGLSVDNNSQLSIDRSVVDGWYDSNGAAAQAEADAISTAAGDATTKANAAQAAAISAAATDATTKANAAQAAAISAAATDATTKANAAQAAAEATAAGDATTKANAAQAAAISAAATDATTKANAAQAAAEATAAAALSTAISTEVSNRNTAISTAVDNLVDGAPALLNTLNELAAAINDDANYTTTITTALGTKAPLASPALTGVPTAPTAAADTNTTQIATTAFAKAEADAAQAAAEATAAADATTKANAAQAAAEATAAGDATTKANAAQAAAEATAAGDATTKANAAQAAAEATAQAALDDVLDSTTPFTDLSINSVAKQVAARVTSLGSVPVTAYQFNKTNFKSGKFLIKIDNGTHNEISEILVTLDSSNNVAITEYAIVGTNGSRGTITADVDATHCRIRVNPVNDSTITVAGTVFNA